MKLSRVTLIAVGCGFLSSPGVAQDSEVLRQELRATYAFSPHELTSAQINEKSQVLDGLWTRAKAQRDSYLPILRSELSASDASPFFLYDGSMLLLSLSDTPPDRRVALRAMSHCDLRDIQHTDYFRQVHRLASLGEDTAEAAFHILDEPKFSAFIPQHALTLGQDYALVYMLLPGDPGLWLGPALARLAGEADPTAQQSLLLLAWYAQTEEADAAIASFLKPAERPPASRTFAQELLARNAKAGLLSRATAMLRSEQTLRGERRELMKRVSDEALIELDQLTLQIAAKRN